MPDFFRTIAGRLTLWYAGIFSVSACVAFILFYYLAVQTLQDQVDQELLDKAGFFAGAMQRSGMAGASNLAVIEAQAAGEKMIFFRLLHPSGMVFATSHMSYWKEVAVDHHLLARMMETRTHVFDTHPMPSGERARILYAFISHNVILQTGIAMDTQSRFLQAFRRVFMVAMGFIILFSAVSGWFLVRKALGRVDTITRTARGITGSSLEQRVPETGSHDELDHLARTFNQMLDRIEHLVRGIREMGDNMAHDLKSPVTRIRGVAEMALIQGESLADFKAMAANTIEESDRLLSMINTMLVISRTEAGEGDFCFEPLNLTRMITSACELFVPVAEDKGIDFSWQVDQEYDVCADERMLQRAFSNLLDNAIKYTEEGGRVRVAVSAEEKKDAVVIRVMDTGPGIHPDVHEKIFTRFFRAEPSRSSPGAGLGLSLARAIAREHGGDIRVQSTPGTGAVFVLRLPYCNAPVI